MKSFRCFPRSPPSIHLTIHTKHLTFSSPLRAARLACVWFMIVLK